MSDESQSETFCVNHPQVATSLRCNRCGNPICIKCAVRTPVGYRCKTCVRNQQAVFYSAMPLDYVIAAVVTLPLAAIGQFAIFFIGPLMGFLVIFVGPLMGWLIAETVWRATGRRRGEYIWLVVAVCMIAAALPALAGSWPLFFQTGGELTRWDLYDLIGFIWPIVYLVLAVSSAVARLRFGR